MPNAADRGRRSCAWLGILVVVLNGCTYWRPSEATPVALLEQAEPREVRVTTREGLEAVLLEPVIKDDSIIGFGGGSTERRAPPRRIAVPVSDVQRLSVREVDAAQSLGATLVAGLAVLGAVFGSFILSCSHNGCT